jgi:hypothetical protein
VKNGTPSWLTSIFYFRTCSERKINSECDSATSSRVIHVELDLNLQVPITIGLDDWQTLLIYSNFMQISIRQSR